MSARSCSCSSALWRIGSRTACRATDEKMCDPPVCSSRARTRRPTASRSDVFAICARVRASSSASTAARPVASLTPSNASHAMSRSMAERALANARVHVVAGNRCKHVRIHQLAHGRAADTRIVVFARRRGNLIALGNRKLFDMREPDRRVRMFLRLSTKPIEKSHEIPSAVRRSATSWPCDAARTCLSMSRMRPSRPI